jgi:hypothetical protein
MKALLLLLSVSLPSLAYAGDDAFDCVKKHGSAIFECTVKKDKVTVESVQINGGECVSPRINAKELKKGDKFTLPYMDYSDMCFYLRKVMIKTSDGKTQTFLPM